VEDEGGRFLKPSGSQAKQVSTTDAEQMGSSLRIKATLVKGVERLVEEL
jgi:hypothetical protein